MPEEKQPPTDVADSRSLREEAAEIRKRVVPALEQLREQRAAMRRALRAGRELLQMPPKEDWRPSQW